MNEKRIIKCNGCDRDLRIPADKRKLEVRCPACSARFFWELKSNKPDLNKLQTADYQRTLKGVCAGKKQFKIIFIKQRSDPYYRFSHNEPISTYRFYEPGDFSTNLWGEEEERFSGREFDFIYDCFHCHSKKKYVYCSGCDQFICGSQRFFERNGDEKIHCPNCGIGSPLITGSCNYVGSTSDLRKPKEKNQLPTPQNQQLRAGEARSNFRALPPKK